MASEIKAGARVFVTALASDGLPHNALGTVVGRAGREWSVRLYGIAECICADAEIHVLRFPDDIGGTVTWLIGEIQTQRDKARAESDSNVQCVSMVLNEIEDRGIDPNELLDAAMKRWGDPEHALATAPKPRLRLV